MTEGSLAPNLLGFHPYDAARRCLKRGLQLHVENPELVWSYGSHGQPCCVTEQLPRPGQRISAPTIVLRVSLRDRQGGVGVREPRPRPPDRPLGAEGRHHLHASWRTAVLAEDNGTGNLELTP